ncbi:MAG: hypothetical protein EOP22_16350 [Hyphomicrobiales bacterium]|nr:MAG: hypothetical protein EOP22_16350 [Hyphomicrobiales bacterium]
MRGVIELVAVAGVLAAAAPVGAADCSGQRGIYLAVKSVATADPYISCLEDSLSSATSPPPPVLTPLPPMPGPPVPGHPDYQELRDLLNRLRLQYDVPNDMWTSLMLDTTPQFFDRPIDLNRFRDLGIPEPGFHQ